MNIRRVFGTVLIAACALATIAIVTPPAAVRAQTTASGQLVITWKVLGGSAPSGYAGKILPVQGAPIVASAAVFENGKFDDVSAQNIYWYLDDNFLGGGAGAQSITFSAPGNNEIMQLQVDMPDFEGGLLNTINVSMVNPQVVIVAPYPNDTFTGSSVSLSAVPYFVNATDLSKLVFNWAVNGSAVTTAENPQQLQVNLSGGAPHGYSLDATVGVQKSGDPYFSIGQDVTLTAP